MNFMKTVTLKLPIEAEEDETHLLESYTAQHMRWEGSSQCYIQI